MNKYTVTIEWINPGAGVIRVHEGESAHFGDSFVWCCTLAKYGSTAMLKGAMTAPPLDAVEPIRDELARYGMTRMSWHRRDRGTGGKGRLTIKPLYLAGLLLVMTVFGMARPNMSRADAPVEARESLAVRLARLSDRCGEDYPRFVRSIMGDKGLWSRQIEIGHSLRDYRTTVGVAGNGVGKSYSVARFVIAWLLQHPRGIAVTTAPTYQQLDGVLWKEMRRAWRGSAIPLGGAFTRSPLKFTVNDDWFCLGLSGSSVEAMSGQHAKNLLFVADEASGVEESKYEAGKSLNPSRELYIGNPLRPLGRFYDMASQAGSNPFINVVRIPSTESPHAHLDRSPVGMADKTWLAAVLAEYGERSIWYLAHVLAIFPGDLAEIVFPGQWLDLAEAAIHVRSGPTRTAIDLGSGGGGDNSEVMTRDDNGILAWDWSNEWSLEATADVAARQTREFQVHPARVSFDRGGLGEDFGNRLAVVGLGGARPYLGGGGGSKTAFNLRSAAARMARWRLDPNRMVPHPRGGTILVKQAPFAIRREWMAHLRGQLSQLRYVLTDGDGSIFKLERKEDMTARLKRSPDAADVFIQSFAFPG